MEMLREWICGICISAIIVSMVKNIAPGNPSGKIVSLVGSIIMIISVIAPVIKSDFEDVFSKNALCNTEYEKIEADFRNTNEKLQSEIIEEEISSYVLKRAETLGVECTSADVTTARDAQGQIKLKSVKIELKENKVKEQIAKVLKEELLISENDIVFKE